MESDVPKAPIVPMNGVALTLLQLWALLNCLKSWRVDLYLLYDNLQCLLKYPRLRLLELKCIQLEVFSVHYDT